MASGGSNWGNYVLLRRVKKSQGANSRRMILEVLENHGSAMTAEQIASGVGLSRGSVETHLRILGIFGHVVRSERHKTFPPLPTRYSLPVSPQ